MRIGIGRRNSRTLLFFCLLRMKACGLMAYCKNEEISKMENSTDVCLTIAVFFLPLQYIGLPLDSQF